jgi:hypothetical protein
VEEEIFPKSSAGKSVFSTRSKQSYRGERVRLNCYKRQPLDFLTDC